MFLCGEVKIDPLILRLSGELGVHQRQGLVNATPSVCIHWFLLHCIHAAVSGMPVRWHTLAGGSG